MSITPALADLGRRIEHDGFFGHKRYGVLNSFGSDGYARVFFDGRPAPSFVTLKNLNWADAPGHTDLIVTPESLPGWLAANPPPPDSESDGDLGLVAVGAVLGGVLSGLADSVGGSADEAPEIEGGGGEGAA